MTAPAIHALLFVDVDEEVVAGSGLVEDDCVEEVENVVGLPREEVKEVLLELLELRVEWLVNDAADEDVDSDCSDETRKIIFVNVL
jgi:hypothetical protein